MSGAGGKLIMGMNEVKVKNFVVAGGLSAFVATVYVYTMKAVGGTDELQAAVETFEREKATKAQAPTST
ncbi:hypothetical protein MPTK1_4g04330 [Marchantia polymorpha subsp. ruderalis]|uniref:Uncharacterized protein n=2 Tax=Marchantia polymorpha TaxID=3197 RepID=A0AAF6B699_MARPO|nr:hypothetical protein MARPO_0044s0040 [Marchantia polymorpha]BBN07533.1 hypothetical protein Mp_4g04330 [Marchantia polymorpha subsp. ruderalis]|eukprot:PTQ39567.1 hypothetical protein MARPO_0044s0040 [Marchantia polymorpha]